MKLVIRSVIVTLLLSGCASLSSHTQPYRPAQGFEKEYFDVSDPTIFPADVRKNLGRDKDKVVAWAGVVTGLRLVELPDQPQATYWVIEAKHHYYNWQIDYGSQPQRYILSSAGEGDFEVVMRLRRFEGAENELAINEVRAQFQPGEMIIAYGRPTWVLDDGRVHLDYGFVSSIAKRDYLVKDVNFGRVIR